MTTAIAGGKILQRMVVAKQWTLASIPTGLPALEHFKCVEKTLPQCKDGDIVTEAEYLTVDPYMRYKISESKAGDILVGAQISKIIESKNDKFAVGSKVISYPGWQSHTHYTCDELQIEIKNGMFYPLNLGNLPISLGLGILGMPGNTAYFGFLEICKPQKGEIVLVNGAGGAVGSAVCQLAKIKECKVIAFAGSDKKVEWLKELGCDHVFNYKTDDISKALKESAPKGIHCYFDNVGGDFTAKVMPHLKEFARISVCGCISNYNNEKFIGTKVVQCNSPYNEGFVIRNQIKIEGFMVTRWLNRWMEGIFQMKSWVEQGKLKYRETVTEGFENMPQAFIGLFKGDNIGKAIVKA